jgi:hypothetical protein
MKNPFFAFFLLINGEIYTQTTVFVSHQNSWQMMSEKFGSWTPDKFTYSFTKDSIKINNRYYRQQIVNYERQPGWKNTGRFFRQEGRKVFIRIDNKDILHYDFGLKLADTLRIDSKYNLKVTKVDTITTLDGVQRRRLNIDSYCTENIKEKYVWLEGIGNIETNFGANLACIIVDPPPEFICFTQNNTIVFSAHTCEEPDNYKRMTLANYVWQMDVTNQETNLKNSRLYTFNNLKKIINNKEYYQLLFSDNPNVNSIKWSPSGRYFREEQGVIYENIDDKDIDVFNFTLEKDSTFGIQTKYVVTATDTILLIDQLPRKRLQLKCLDSDQKTVIWIEGIGDSETFLQSVMACNPQAFVEITKLRCVLSNIYFKTLYKAPWAAGCIVVGTSDPAQRFDVDIYPNPTSDFIHIRFAEEFSGQIRIMDIFGNTILSRKLSGLQSSIPLFTHPKGLYLLQFQNTQGKTLTKKIIVD